MSKEMEEALSLYNKGLPIIAAIEEIYENYGLISEVKAKLEEGVAANYE